MWGLRPKLFGGARSESVLSSRATTPVTPPVTRQATEPTPQSPTKEPTSKAEVIEAVNETKDESSPENESAMDVQNTTQIRLEGDMIVPLNEQRPKTYADMTNLALKFPDFAEQILALPLPAVQATIQSTTLTDAVDEIDSLSLPRKSRKTSRADRPTRQRGGRGQKTHDNRNLPHKSPKNTHTASSTSPINRRARSGSPGVQNMTPVYMRTPTSMHRNTPPQTYFNPTPSPTPSPVGSRPTNNDVDALIALLQKARTTDPALLQEVELGLKLSQQVAPRSPHLPVAPLGMQSINHAEFASWGKKPNGEMGYVPRKTFTPPHAQGFNNAYPDYNRRRSGPTQRGSPTPPGMDGSPLSNRSSPRGAPGKRHVPNRSTRMSLPATRPSPKPPVRPVWPTSKDDLTRQVLPTSAGAGKIGTKRIGPSLDDLTSPQQDSVDQHATSVFAIRGN